LPAIDELIDARIKAILKEELRSFAAPTTRLVDLATLGPPKRFMYREARAGKIEGAVKMNGHWYAPQTGVDKWIGGHAEKMPRAAGRSDERHVKTECGLDAIRSRLGLVRIG
jgi:hypothetical protein